MDLSMRALRRPLPTVPTLRPLPTRSGLFVGARNDYATFFYRQRQDDSHLYHLIIDSTALPTDACIDIIVAAVQARTGDGEAQTAV